MNDYEVRAVPVKVVRDFIQEHHYSKSINGVKISACFGLYDGEQLVGAALFGPLSTTAWKRYGKNECEVVELRRLVCLDECPRNTESWLISRCIKWLKRNSEYLVCVSYADPRHGHSGTIYQAANWSYWGATPKDKVLVTDCGREYHSRAMRTKYKGELKPFAARLVALKNSGNLREIEVPGKHIYTYRLDSKQSAEGVRNYPKLSAEGSGGN